MRTTRFLIRELSRIRHSVMNSSRSPCTNSHAFAGDIAQNSQVLTVSGDHGATGGLLGLLQFLRLFLGLDLVPCHDIATT